QEGSWRATPEREAPEHGDRRRRQRGRPPQRTPPHRTGPQRRWPEDRESRATPREQPTSPEQPSAATQSACRSSRSLTTKTTGDLVHDRVSLSGAVLAEDIGRASCRESTRT